MILWGDSKRDHDLILAVWPRFDPYYDRWWMQELAYSEGAAPGWRARRVATEKGRVRADIYEDETTSNPRHRLSLPGMPLGPSGNRGRTALA